MWFTWYVSPAAISSRMRSTDPSYRSRGWSGATCPRGRAACPPRRAGRGASSPRRARTSRTTRAGGRERVVGVARAHGEVRIEAGRGLVGDEPGDPQAAPGRRLGGLEGGDDLTGARGLQHADRLDEPERRRGAGEVVEPRFEHGGTIRAEVEVHGSRRCSARLPPPTLGGFGTMICSTCGTENEPGRKFCGECGASLSVECPNCGARTARGSSSAANAERPGPGCARRRNRPRPGRGAAPRLGPVRRPRRLHDAVRDPGSEVRELLTRYFDTSRRLIARYGAPSRSSSATR